jgi:riboflavin synthase
MFTGIVTAIGQLHRRRLDAEDGRLTIACPDLGLDDVALGDSIAVNGVCLTVAALGDAQFEADISVETLQRSCLGEMPLGSDLNLEKALAVNGRLGGHIVSGHVDGVGQVLARESRGRAERFVIAAASDIMRYIASKGSVAVDGVSLTVNDVGENRFELMLIPHTLQSTVIPRYQVGRRVHLEVDIMARYAERLLQLNCASAGKRDQPGVDFDTLARHGFV